jgi:hypothetical protein
MSYYRIKPYWGEDGKGMTVVVELEDKGILDKQEVGAALRAYADLLLDTDPEKDAFKN